MRTSTRSERALARKVSLRPCPKSTLSPNQGMCAPHRGTRPQRAGGLVLVSRYSSCWLSVSAQSK